MGTASTLTMFHGRRADWTIAATISGSPANLTGYEIFFTAKRAITDRAVVFQKTIGDGITVTDAVGGILTIRLEPEDTKQLPLTVSQLEYDLTIDDGSGDVRSPDRGTIMINPSITIRP